MTLCMILCMSAYSLSTACTNCVVSQQLHLVGFAQGWKLITAKTHSDKIKSLNTWPMATGGICARSPSTR